MFELARVTFIAVSLFPFGFYRNVYILARGNLGEMNSDRSGNKHRWEIKGVFYELGLHFRHGTYTCLNLTPGSGHRYCYRSVFVSFST